MEVKFFLLVEWGRNVLQDCLLKSEPFDLNPLYKIQFQQIIANFLFTGLSLVIQLDYCFLGKSEVVNHSFSNVLISWVYVSIWKICINWEQSVPIPLVTWQSHLPWGREAHLLTCNFNQFVLSYANTFAGGEDKWPTQYNWVTITHHFSMWNYLKWICLKTESMGQWTPLKPPVISFWVSWMK